MYVSCHACCTWHFCFDLSEECVLLLQNVFCYYRMCSLTTECFTWHVCFDRLERRRLLVCFAWCILYMLCIVHVLYDMCFTWHFVFLTGFGGDIC